jgi:hypothetical protein
MYLTRSITRGSRTAPTEFQFRGASLHTVPRRAPIAPVGGLIALLVLASAGVRIPPTHAADPPSPPASGWLFDDGDGITAADTWGARPGTLQGGMGTANWLSSTPNAYPGNRCLSFDGVNDRVLVSLGQILATYEASTVSAWFQWTNTSPRKEYAIYSERDECQYNIFVVEVEDRLGVTAGVAHGVFDRNPFPAVCGSGIWNVARAGNGLPSSDAWHHVVAIRKADGEVRIFVDRELVSVQSGVARYIGPAGPTTIGHTHTVGYDGYFAGNLDEIGVWTTALTDSEAVWLHDHSLRDLLLAGVETPRGSPTDGIRLTAGPLPYRGGTLSIAWSRPAGSASGVFDLVVTDLQGRTVREIATVGPTGARGVLGWNGTDRDGRAVRAGVYFLSATAGRDRRTLPIVILR